MQEWLISPGNKKFIPEIPQTIFDGTRKFIAHCGQTFISQTWMKKHVKDCWKCQHG